MGTMFTVLVEQDVEGYYVATVPALRSCYTQARTLEQLYPRIKQIIELYLEERRRTHETRGCPARRGRCIGHILIIAPPVWTPWPGTP